MATRPGEVFFLDTNVLLTATDRSRESHEAALAVLERSRRSGHHLALSGQIIREYLVVATRRLEDNGLGMSPPDALKNAAEFRRRTVFCEETEAVASKLEALVRAHGVTGKRIHDANVAATILTHGIAKLVTENVEDFARFEGIETLDTAAAMRVLSAG